MARVILDSSVLISIFHDGDHHGDAVKSFMQGKENVYFISAISFSETLTHAARKGAPALEKMVKRIRYAIPEMFDVTSEIALEAAKVRARTHMALPDAIISATASSTGAELWTLDKKLAKGHPGAILIA